MAHHHESWISQGFSDRTLIDVEPYKLRERIEEVTADMLLPEGEDLVVENYFGRELRIKAEVGSHLTHATIGFASREIPQQRIMERRYADAVAGQDGIQIEELEDGLVRVTWEQRQYGSRDWIGHAALSFWHKEGQPGQFDFDWHEPLEIAERVMLSGYQFERGLGPILHRQVTAPPWSGGRYEVYDIPEIEPRPATETEALGFLSIFRDVVPDYWRRFDNSV